MLTVVSRFELNWTEFGEADAWSDTSTRRWCIKFKCCIWANRCVYQSFIDRFLISILHREWLSNQNYGLSANLFHNPAQADSEQLKNTICRNRKISENNFWIPKSTNKNKIASKKEKKKTIPSSARIDCTLTSIFVRPTSRTSGITRNGNDISLVVR